MKMTKTKSADPFEFSRLYGQEKYSLDNMTLASVNFPDVVDSGKITSEWSDRIFTSWDAASKDLKSTYNADAFWAGVSSTDLLTFAKAIAEAVNFTHEVTGVRIVRFTNAASGYPVLRIDITSGGKKNPVKFHYGRPDRWPSPYERW
jgi:hypothetical protein